VDFCLWQLLVLLGVVGVLASVVLMVVLRWNPVQWFGWVLTAVATVSLLHVGLYGMNEYAGSIAQDAKGGAVCQYSGGKKHHGKSHSDKNAD
jgi:hypothetical protein